MLQTKIEYVYIKHPNYLKSILLHDRTKVQIFNSLNYIKLPNLKGHDIQNYFSSIIQLIAIKNIVNPLRTEGR